MKQIIIILTLLNLLSCSSSKELISNIENYEKEITNSQLDDVFIKANNLFIERDKGAELENLGTLHSIERLGAEVYEGEFLEKGKKVLLVSFNGSSGFSAGNGNRLTVIGAFQKGEFNILFYSQDTYILEIGDYNNDGVLDVYTNFISFWMGVSSDIHSIMTYKNGVSLELYKYDNSSTSEELDFFTLNKKGDTISNEIYLTFVESKKDKYIIKTKVHLVHNGGENNLEILKNAIRKIETEDLYYSK